MAFERDTLDGGNASTANLDDLIDRLRIQGKDAFFQHYSLGMFKLCAEAADAIEELRSDCAELETLADARCSEKRFVEDDLRAAEARIAELEAAIQRIGKRARSDGNRTFDDTISDLVWIDDECRALRPSPKGGEE